MIDLPWLSGLQSFQLKLGKYVLTLNSGSPSPATRNKYGTKYHTTTDINITRTLQRRIEYGNMIPADLVDESKTQATCIDQMILFC